MRHLRQLTATAFIALAVMILMVTAASAQGRYSARYSRNDVSNIIRTLEQSSNRFTLDFDREMDRSPLNGTREEDRYNALVRDYANSLDRLRREFDRSDSWWSTRNDVQNVIARAQPVNDMMNSISFRRNIERQWTTMRNDINRLADTFDLPGLAGGGWSGGRPTGPQGNVPNWAQGTFYGRNPLTGGSIVLNVSANGTVAISFDGNSPVYAAMNGTTLRNGLDVARVSRINNGIRTTRVDDGSIIDYYRSPNTGGGYPNYPPVGGNVPSWALGTFQGRNPQTGGSIMMTIERSGRVTIVFENGTTAYASINGTTLTNGPDVARVSQIRNGIRTTLVTDGSYIDYYRRR